MTRTTIKRAGLLITLWQLNRFQLGIEKESLCTNADFGLSLSKEIASFVKA